MTNADKFKTREERGIAFESFCADHDCVLRGDRSGKWLKLPYCPLSKNVGRTGYDCRFAWLELKYEEPEPELKPCPFCGKKPNLCMENDAVVVYYTVKCSCGIRTCKTPVSTVAVHTWNRRAK